MPTLGTPANEVQSTLSATFTRGTDTNIVLAVGGGADFPSTPQVVRLTDGTHWCLLIYSSKSTDTLVMASATDYALANNVSSGDAAYVWPVGSTVELVAAADYVDQLQDEDAAWTKDRDANGYDLNNLGGLIGREGADLKVEMAAPTGAAAVAAAGGTLVDGTYYYKITALDGIGETIGSSEVSATTSLTDNSVTISWSAVTGAASYRVYGRATGAQDQYWATTSTSLTDDGTAGTAGTVPTSTTAYVNKLTASGASWNLGGNTGFGISTPSEKVDIVGRAILLGADLGAPTTRSDSVAKVAFSLGPHYTSGEEAVVVYYGYSASGINQVVFGGGSSSFNAATVLRFFTTSTSTTVAGTEKMRIDDAGLVSIGTATGAYILTIQQTSATDPIADAWNVYSTEASKELLRDINPHGYYDRLKEIPLKEWRRQSVLDDGLNDVLARHSLWQEGKDPDEHKAELGKRKAARTRKLQKRQTKLHAKHVGPLAEDVPEEIQARDRWGNPIGIDLAGYCGFLHAALREIGERVEALEDKLIKARVIT